jgi:hypothetical protein
MHFVAFCNHIMRQSDELDKDEKVGDGTKTKSEREEGGRWARSKK